MSEQSGLQALKAPFSFIQVRPNVLQRQCACGQHSGVGECESCKAKEGALQRAAVNSASVNSAPPIAGEVLNSPGQALDNGTRSFMEARFGYDFSQVKVHIDSRANEAARSVNALAYTVGPNIVFGAGQYAPGTAAGQRLLAHELTHVIQQKGNAFQAKSLEIGAAHDPGEAEADRVAEAVLAGGAVRPDVSKTKATPPLQRQTAGEARTTEPSSNFNGCQPPLQDDLRAKHQAALRRVQLAITRLAGGRSRMAPADLASFQSYFDPSGSGEVDDDFIRDVRANYQRIYSYMAALTFDCDPGSWTICGTSRGWCVGGRLMWTCFGALHVCPAYATQTDERFKIETIIHESTHNALHTTDRAYSSEARFRQLRPRGSGILRFLSNIPVLGALFRLIRANNDTLYNPDSYAEFAMSE